MTQQRVVVITGASSGIGLETAKAFARMGWHVIGHGRDAGRSVAAKAAIEAECDAGGTVDFLRANLSLMQETLRLAGEIKSLTGHIDVLINNAGGIRDAKYLTAEGTEETFAGNHLAPFLLTRELMPLIEAAAAMRPPGSVRILAVSSIAYARASKGLNFGDIQHLTGEFVPGSVYCEAKLANQLFSLALDRRLAGKGIVSQALVPGPVYTNFFSYGDQRMKEMIKTAAALTPAEVSETLVWMATASETGAPGGRMFYEMKEQPTLPHATDEAAADRLWSETEQILAELGV